MHIDDMLATSLAWPLPDRAASVRAWLQLVDMLGTRAVVEVVDPALLDAAYARLDMLRRSLGDDASRLASPLLAGRALPDRLSRLIDDGIDAGDEEPGDSPILDLIERIDAFQAQPVPPPTLPAPPRGFAFAIDEDGRFSDAGGTSLAAQAAPEPHGLDGQALGAWRAHAEIIDARLSLTAGPFAGDWRISAEPSFDEGGAFRGYTGWARQPRADEDAAAPVMPAIAPEVMRADRFDRAVAALRSPLAGVTDFAGEQALPEGDARAAAAQVVERSLELADAIDSFDLAAEASAEPQRIEAADLLARLHAALLPLAEARRVALSFRIVQDLPPVDVEAHLVERMFARLIGASVALGRSGERMVVRLGRDREDGSRMALVMTRPGRLTGRPAIELEATGSGSADASMLAFGFALRLVDRLAEEAGGALRIHADRLVLSLPLRALPERRSLRG